jgi:hypothetical protein
LAAVSVRMVVTGNDCEGGIWLVAELSLSGLRE